MIEQIYQIYLDSTGICTDTRSLSTGNLFVALKGPNFNANKFASKALENGAIMAIIDDADYQIEGKTLLVDDGLETLQKLAQFHRSKLDIPIICITGSNGKTTTKELMHAVLDANYSCFATHGNLNNHIGVPLSLLSINKDHDIAIIEMGANHIGEIAQLSAMARPTHGLITNIGKAHIGLFGGFEGVIRAKSELYDFLIKNEGVIFVNQQQEILMNMSKRMKDPVFYPNADSYFPCELVGADPFVQVKTEDESVVTSNLIGSYNFDNIATALCIGKYFNVPSDKANAAVEAYTPTNNRSQIIQKGSNSIIMDAYNANPSSMAKAIENLANMKAANKLVIVGDMYELGDDTQAEHEQIGILLKKLGFSDAIFCGEYIQSAFDSFGGGMYMANKDELISHLEKTQREDTTILIKASRGMALEDVVDYL